uniref:Programmed cell death 2 n=1 Tax=Lates calcarifer TaxID=8187 RepID=A0A4W6FYX2_LATCA
FLHQSWRPERSVVLGFLEEAEPWRLRSPQFPSKVGGKPAWLSQRGLPSLPELECETCRLPMVFLLQVYAPVSGQDRTFHRTLFLFCCKTPEKGLRERGFILWIGQTSV